VSYLVYFVLSFISVHTSQVAHQAGAFARDGMLVHRWVTTRINFVCTLFVYLPWREALREINIMSSARGLEPRLFFLKTSALTTRPLRTHLYLL